MNLPNSLRLALNLALAGRNTDYLLLKQWDYPRQEELFPHTDLGKLDKSTPYTRLGLSWEEILYGTSFLYPDYCLGCQTKHGMVEGGRVRTACHLCKGSQQEKARSIWQALSIVLGYHDNLLTLLIAEASKWIPKKEAS